jgi:hypothetical protein
MTRSYIEATSDTATDVFIATINNATESDHAFLMQLEQFEPLKIGQRARLRGLVAGVEHGPLRGAGYVAPSNYNTAEAKADRESRKEQTPHLQLYCQTTLKVKPSAMRAALEKAMGREVGYLVAANGSLDDNECYVSKEDSSPIRYGHIEEFEAAIRKTKGERMDLKLVKEDIDAGMEWEELRDKHFGAFAAHEQFFKKYKGALLEKEIKTDMASTFEQVVWKPWQQSVIDIASGPVQNRKCHVVVDKNGNSGKSYLSNYLAVKMGFLILNPVSRRDLGFILTSTLNSGINVPGVVIDIARSVVGSGLNEHLPNTAMASIWNFVEALHDGRITNTKYESQTLFFKQPHVMIFTNHDVEIRSEFTLSADRWNVMKLSGGILLQHCPGNWD